MDIHINTLESYTGQNMILVVTGLPKHATIHTLMAAFTRQHNEGGSFGDLTPLWWSVYAGEDTKPLAWREQIPDGDIFLVKNIWVTIEFLGKKSNGYIRHPRITLEEFLAQFSVTSETHEVEIAQEFRDDPASDFTPIEGSWSDVTLKNEDIVLVRKKPE